MFDFLKARNSADDIQIRLKGSGTLQLLRPILSLVEIMFCFWMLSSKVTARLVLRVQRQTALRRVGRNVNQWSLAYFEVN